MTEALAQIQLFDEARTAALAAKLAPILRAGDALLLEGEIGAGKSAFCRALIRARAGAEIDVPSPTFTLVQTYDLDGLEFWHCDLYRLTSPEEVLELGLEEAFDEAVCLIEWPDRLQSAVPETALTLRFAAHAESHSVAVIGPNAWSVRLKDVLKDA